MGDLFYGIQAHHSMPSDLDKGIAPKPSHKISQRIIGRKFLAQGVHPSAPIPSQDRRNLTPGK
jgi:hypothetical protein